MSAPGLPSPHDLAASGNILYTDPAAVASSIADGQYAETPVAPVIRGTQRAPRLSAQEFDASYFGFRSSPLAGPNDVGTYVAQAPDSSAAVDDLLDFFANWREKPLRPTVIRFGPGVFKSKGVSFAENPDVFYPRSGFSIEGAGSHATVWAALPGDTSAQLIGLSGQTNWVNAPELRRIRLYGAGLSNPYQVGVFLNPNYVNSQGFGGVTGTYWDDVRVGNFAREQMWLKGGAEDFLVPVQYGVWRAIRVDALTNDYHALKLTGQIGPPWNFVALEVYGTGNDASKIAYAGLDNRTGLALVGIVNNALVFAEPHRLKTGDRFRLVGGTAWGGLPLNTDVFAFVVDDFRVRVATTKANAYANPPTLVTLTAAAGTATVSVVQVAGVNQCMDQLVFDTPTFQFGGIGLEVTGGSSVFINNQHTEETTSALKVDATSTVQVAGGKFGNAAKSGGILFDDTSGGRIILSGYIDIKGTTNRILAGAVNDNKSAGTPAGFAGSYYPTIGSGVSNKIQSYTQLGNTAEIDLGQRINAEYLLNTGNTTITHFRWQCMPGNRNFFRVFDGGQPAVSIAESGNILLGGLGANGGILRLPINAYFEVIATSLNQGVTIGFVRMPTHTGSWAMGTGTLAAGARATTTVACPGARVGDLAPQVSLSQGLPTGVDLEAVISATDTATVSAVNNGSATSGALPGTVTVFVRQTR